MSKSQSKKTHWRHNRHQAEIYYSQGDYESCERLWQQVLAAVRSFPEYRADYCHALDRMGQVLLDQGKYVLSLEYFKKALDMKYTLYGEKHFSVADSFGHLAKLHFMQGDYGKSETWAVDCAAHYRAVLGEESRQLACAYHNLATLYRAQGKLDVAESFYKRSLEMKLNVFGQSHLEFVNLLRSYADMLRQMGRQSEAEHLDDCASGRISGKWFVPDQRMRAFNVLQIQFVR